MTQRIRLVVPLVLFLAATAALAQIPRPSTPSAPAAAQPAEQEPATPPPAAQPEDEHTPPQPSSGPVEVYIPPSGMPAPNVAPPPERSFLDMLHWPEVSLPGLTLFAVVVVLITTITTRPMGTLRTLDGITLAAMAVLLAYRFDTMYFFRNWSTQAVAYLLLTLIGVYWIGRGYALMRAPSVPRGECNLSEGAQLIIGLAGLTVALFSLSNSPISHGSRDGVVGGVHLAHTGRLPYGQTVGYDSQSPLTYVVYAGAVQVIEPLVGANGQLVPFTWENRSRWSTVRWEDEPVGAVRLVNSLIFLMTFMGILLVGRRLHSPAMGMAMASMFCVFPGVLEALAQPDIMLPTMLLTWSLAFALIPGIGGLLSTLTIVLAGFAWPWAWLALPVLVAYSMRRGWEGLGSLVALLAGGAASLVAVLWLTQPGLPRADGALKGAGLSPAHMATAITGGGVRVEPNAAAETPPTDFKSGFWRWLVQSDNAMLDSSAGGRTGVSIEFVGVETPNILYRNIRVEDDVAREALTRDYAARLKADPGSTECLARLRTLLEATWIPAQPAAPPVKGAWALWMGDDGSQAEFWLIVRRVTKVAIGLLALLVAVMVYYGNLNQPYQLIGALLVVTAATLLASTSGAVAKLPWLIVMIVAVLAANGQAWGAAARANNSGLPPPRPAAAPRISVER